MKWVLVIGLFILGLVLIWLGVRTGRKIKEKGVKMYIFERAYGPVVEEYPCHILGTSEWAPQTNYIFDFSRYEDIGIIGFILQSPNVNQGEEETVGLVPNQTVYKFEDGTMLWV